MSSARLRLNHTFTFGVGMLVVLACLFFSGMVESRGPACSMGLGRPEIYMPYEGTSYGWPVTAVQVGRIACQGPPEAWTPKPFIAWHANGVLISGVQMLAGGLLTLVIGGRLFSAAGGHG